MIRIVVTGDDRVAQRLQGMSDKIRQALADELRRQWFGLQSYIVKSKLSGRPALNRVTGNLASSINVGGADSATEFSETPALIVGRVGTRVIYGRVHEYGGTFKVRGYKRTITQAFGRPIDPVTVEVPPHTVTFPERSFLRSGLSDMSGQIRAGIRQAVEGALRA